METALDIMLRNKKKEIEGRGLADDFVKKIDTAIQGMGKVKHKKKQGFTPSETNLCTRYWWYLFHGMDMVDDLSGRVQRIFDTGHSTHERLAKYFDKAGILVHEEFRIDPPLNLPVPFGTMYIDAIVEFMGLRVIEMKSISTDGFDAVARRGTAKDDHYRQIQIYFAALEKIGMKIAGGFVLYENKNNQELLAIEVSKDNEFLDKLWKKLGKIYDQYLSGVKPDRPYKSITSTSCQYCNLKEFCWSKAED